ncbi:uncharacterized protein [Nerophis lumbriciformis]|uniref:uncharacterized protein isoform X2 n=1 Tax=Nerophis lumbriciformis TaxID=546530 RepID=UPI002ADFCA89|nr:uncharacterized protein LOC133616512 isoform X2 [Nerophis lumbriciformis]
MYAAPMECKRRSLGTQTEQKDHFTSITTSTMDVLSAIRHLYSHDVAEMLEQILPMLPSSFSVEEANLYQEEKLLLRQFVIMKQLGEVPSYVSVEHMKQWILSRRSFLEEFQGFDVKMNRKMFRLLESAWISARFICLNKMEKEVWEDIQEEVTLEGFHMFLLVVCPKAEEEVEWFLRHLFNRLQSALRTSTIISMTKRLMLLSQFHRCTDHLVKGVVERVVCLFLDKQEPGSDAEMRHEVARIEIVSMLAYTLSCCSWLSPHIAEDHLLHLCTLMVREMIQSMLAGFAEYLENFLLNFDESFLAPRDSIKRAINDLVSIATSECGSAFVSEKGHKFF